jgi:peptidoglycan-associated lipoprotein
MKLRQAALLSIAASMAFACSKPAAPTPEITEPAPTAGAAATTPAADPAASTPADSGVAFSTVYFDFDSYSLTGSAKAELQKIATTLKSQQSVRIQVEGHCDERGSNEYNLALGERRARAIQEFLTAEGVSNTNLSTISYGEERPAVVGSTEEAWAKNRRGEFRRL